MRIFSLFTFMKFINFISFMNRRPQLNRVSGIASTGPNWYLTNFAIFAIFGWFWPLFEFPASSGLGSFREFWDLGFWQICDSDPFWGVKFQIFNPEKVKNDMSKSYMNFSSLRWKILYKFLLRKNLYMKISKFHI